MEVEKNVVDCEMGCGWLCVLSGGMSGWLKFVCYDE